MAKYLMKILILWMTIFFSCVPEERAEWILANGNIITLTENPLRANTLVIGGGKILAVGDSTIIPRWKNKKTRIINLKGATVIPGFIEGHGHLLSFGLQLSRVQLADAASYQEVIRRVREEAERIPKGEWIIGRGWHQDKWNDQFSRVKGFPVHDPLSAAVPEHPVCLIHASGHAVLVNRMAMEIAEVKPGTPDPEGGEIIRYPNGQPTGVFVENAENLIYRSIPPLTPERKREVLLKAQEECFRYGITMFHDAGEDQETIQLIKGMYGEGLLRMRLYMMISGDDSATCNYYVTHGPEYSLFDDHLFIRAVKLYIDGALGSRGAWLIEPYADRPDYTGEPVNPPEKLEKMTELAVEKGFQVCTHAIGDRGNRTMLHIYRKILEKYPDPTSFRLRIEHAQHLQPEDFVLFGQYGIIASMQAVHFASDIDWAIDRLGERRIRNGSYAWKSLLNAGAVLMNGTDVPVESIDPIRNYYTAVSRKNFRGEFREWYNQEETLSRMEALRSYTLNNAYGAFLEKKLGTIEPGKYADLTVLSADITTVPEDSILRISVKMTFVNGNIVYDGR